MSAPAPDRTYHPPETVDGSALDVQTTALVSLSGEVDGTTLDALLSAVGPTITAEHRLVLDMSAVDFLSPSGLGALLGLHRECESRGLLWALVAGEPVRTMLGTLDGIRPLPVVDSLADALAVARVPGRTGCGVMPVVAAYKVHC